MFVDSFLWFFTFRIWLYELAFILLELGRLEIGKMCFVVMVLKMKKRLLHSAQCTYTWTNHQTEFYGHVQRKTNWKLKRKLFIINFLMLHLNMFIKVKKIFLLLIALKSTMCIDYYYGNSITINVHAVNKPIRNVFWKMVRRWRYNVPQCFLQFFCLVSIFFRNLENHAFIMYKFALL